MHLLTLTLYKKQHNELKMYHFLINISYFLFTSNIFSILIEYTSRYIIKNLNKIKLYKNDNRIKKILNLHFSRLPTWSTWPWLTLEEAQGVAHSNPPRPRTFNTLNVQLNRTRKSNFYLHMPFLKRKIMNYNKTRFSQSISIKILNLIPYIFTC